jgi:hypothetical protein
MDSPGRRESQPTPREAEIFMRLSDQMSPDRMMSRAYKQEFELKSPENPALIYTDCPKTPYKSKTNMPGSTRNQTIHEMSQTTQKDVVWN